MLPFLPTYMYTKTLLCIQFQYMFLKLYKKSHAKINNNRNFVVTLFYNKI